jgi:hypothetical protein
VLLGIVMVTTGTSMTIKFAAWKQNSSEARNEFPEFECVVVEIFMTSSAVSS